MTVGRNSVGRAVGALDNGIPEHAASSSTTNHTPAAVKYFFERNGSQENAARIQEFFTGKQSTGWGIGFGRMAFNDLQQRLQPDGFVQICLRAGCFRQLDGIQHRAGRGHQDWDVCGDG